jgi:L,D-peptidoglycan transpeptidase YkuD (ErfK/YbiS/YcfS/YnhG family)
MAGPLALPVALGRGGIRANKREGDGGTPLGVFRPKRVWWRGDRPTRPQTNQPGRRNPPHAGWWEDPSDPP